MKVSEIFQHEPVQWGFRGDPFLWREMAERLKDTEMPAQAADLKTILESTYSEITGFQLSHREPFVVERFKHGGMSSGGISPEFWVERGIPILVGRHVKP